ncbi:hypothetical protein IC582_001351 [Cucumis melo]|uniref:Expansin-like A2 n=1 Tax=Cucumis melo TaxID=3656 RepID=A0A1S4DWU6_CUCME|nr:expansin-like A2 [Cucumis melo]
MPFFLLLLFLSLFSSATACDRCIHQAKAAFYQDEAAGLYRGACGYGDLTLQLSNGYFSAIMPPLYKYGAGCGACFQVRCKNEKICSKEGTKIIVTDRNDNTYTGLVLSQKAFGEMAVSGKDGLLLSYGVVDVEFKRIPCEYNNLNLMVRVEEWSQYPNYLAIKLLNQGGQTEIVAIDIAQVGYSNWDYMGRNYGAVWETKKPAPKGPLQLRFVVTSGYDGKYIWAKHVLPADWRPGLVYDTGVQIYDIAKEGCPTEQCGDGQWKRR